MAAKLKAEKAVKPAKKAEVKEARKTAKYSAPLFAKSGATSGETNLPEAIFASKPNASLLAQAARVYLSNQRTARAKTKTRAEINRTTKKVYKQKGTGGARHGSRKAPIYVGGGIAHGPRGMQNYKLTLPLNMKKIALSSALFAKHANKQLVVGDVEKIDPKAKTLSAFLKKANLDGKVTIVHAGSGDLVKAGRNIKGVTLIPATNLSAYDCLVGGNLLFTNEALPVIEKRFTKSN